MVLCKMHVGVTLRILVNTVVRALNAAITLCMLSCLRSLVSYISCECNFIYILYCVQIFYKLILNFIL